ncbi:MAG: peptidoglycan-associated lipoprotein Pal [candidate division Zixibacteria bacterium]|nr:peptidoglycan-associated lipoprotein Pal [candidate division Zixibacteria bacterium]
MAGCGSNAPRKETGQGGAGGHGPGTADQPGGVDDGSHPGGRGEVTEGTGSKGGFKTIYFDFDKYNLREDARTTLNANADLMRKSPDMHIVIEGHCDERGTDEYNLALGEKRARSAKEYLEKLGIDSSRIDVISYGEERPIATGHDEESWQRNRRGEFMPK